MLKKIPKVLLCQVKTAPKELNDPKLSSSSSDPSSFISSDKIADFEPSNLEMAKKYAERIMHKLDVVPLNIPSTLRQNHTEKTPFKNISWEIKAKEIKFKETIGRGSYGTVYRTKYYGEAAVKVINVKNPTEEDTQSFKNEVFVLSKLRHEYILLFMGCVTTPYTAIVTEWCDGFSLYRELHVNERIFKPLSILYIARQLAEGMSYLHAKNIIHRDLKSNNVFLTDMGVIKIGDFGLATVMTMIETTISKKNRLLGSVYWMAPEVIRQRDNCTLSFASDIYAFGIVLYELITGQLPHSELDHIHQILFKVGSSKKPISLKNMRPDLPVKLKNVMHKCSHFDSSLRPAFPFVIKKLLKMIDVMPKIQRSVSDSHLTSSHMFC